jgi:hypothetical protein
MRRLHGQLPQIRDLTRRTLVLYTRTITLCTRVALANYGAYTRTIASYIRVD